MVLALAGASGLAGLTAGPQATGVDLVDGAFRAGLCALSVVLVARGGSRSRRHRVVSRWMVAAAGAVALLAAGPSSAWMAGAGFGLALGAASARLNGPVLRALSAGFIAQAALRLGRPSIALGTALAAVAVFGLLIAGGITGLRSGARRRSIRVGLAIAGAAVVTSALGAWAAYQARPKVVDGIAAAGSGVAQARAGDVNGSASHFDEADRSFRSASRLLGGWWARPAMVVPVVGRHSRALLAIAESGSALSGAGARTVRQADVTQIGMVNGTVPLDRIAELHAPAREAHLALSRADERLGGMDSPWLVSPVSSRLEVLSARVSQARRDAEVASLTSEVAPALLGAGGQRRYLLAIQTPSELRASGGFLGNFGEISADRGRLSLDRLGRANDIDFGGDPDARRLELPADFASRYTELDGVRYPVNATFSPDFPTVARLLSGLYPQSGGRPVDGVVAIDPIALGALLKVLGPIQIREWPVPITGDNAEQVLLFEQYVRLQGAARVDFLSRVTDAVWKRLTSSNPNLVQLAGAVGPMVAEKHIQLASVHPPEQRAFAELGADGAMGPVEGDFLGVVTQNYGGNKLDWFLRRSVAYDARVDPGSGELRANLRVTLRNLVPSSGLPAHYLANAAQPPLPPGTNKLYLSIYTPWSFSMARLDGKPLSLQSQRELGRRVYSTYITLPPGGSSTVELELTGRLAGEDYRLDLHRQPFLAPDEVSASLEVPAGWKVGRSSGARKASNAYQLTSDEAMALSLHRSG